LLRPAEEADDVTRERACQRELHRPQRPVEPRPHDGGDVLLGVCAASVTLWRIGERSRGRNSDGYGNVSVGESLASGQKSEHAPPARLLLRNRSVSEREHCTLHGLRLP
ncbi:hypothetical protein B0H14DRAFT_3875892, partial [Mycena olivaceomarginata]